MLLVLFGLFISPVVYCYYLQYNLHPEIMVRGKDHINGVKFILLNQSIERFSGAWVVMQNMIISFFFILFSGPLHHGVFWPTSHWLRELKGFVQTKRGMVNYRCIYYYTIDCFLFRIQTTSLSQYCFSNYGSNG